MSVADLHDAFAERAPQLEVSTDVAQTDADIVVMMAATDGTVLDQADLSADSGLTLYSAVPSCDKIYVADEGNQANIPVLDLATLDAGTALVPNETPSADGFYGYNGDRSLDGSVVVITGYYSSDAMVIIKSSQCASALPDTGADTTTLSVIGGVALIVLLAGTTLVVVRRRRMS